MKTKLLNLLIISALIFSACDNQPRAKHKRHVHNTSHLTVFFAPETNTYYGYDATRSTWYQYSQKPAASSSETRTVTSTASAPNIAPPINAPTVTTNAPSTVERGGFGAIGQDFYGQTTSKSFGLPPGGGWSQVSAKPQNLELEELPEAATEITTDESGQALDETTVEAENSMDATVEASEAADSSSSDSDSGSSDSGSSDSGGGDGGGGGD